MLDDVLVKIIYKKNPHLRPGPETGWDTWEFFPGPIAPRGPMGVHREGKIENFWIEKMIFRLT